MRIAIVEISESHEECIYSQVSFLKDEGYKIDLFAHPAVIKQAASYSDFLDSIQSVSFDGIKGVKAIALQMSLTKKLANYDKVIFNTASSSKSLRNIALFLTLFKVEVIGVLHDAKRLEKSFTQKLFSYKIKKYFVLNDFIKENYKNAKTSKLESFYPIYFPSFKKEVLQKKENEIWITIPGRVYYSRRNYQFLLNQLKHNSISKNIKFLLLGNSNTNDGNDFLSNIELSHIEHHFIVFNTFISNELYYSYIQKSDYILPLLNLKDESYLKSKITGTFNLAFGFKKIMLCNEKLSVIPDIKNNGITYSEDTFINVINSLDRDHNLKVYTDEKWTYDFQKNKYLTVLNS